MGSEMCIRDSLVIGASANSTSLTNANAGASYVLFGRSRPFPGTLNLSSFDGVDGLAIFGAGRLDRSGVSVASAGDFNNDGVGDLVIGAVGDRNSATNQTGRSYIVYGDSAIGLTHPISLAQLDSVSGLALLGEFVGEFTGERNASADLNNDGVSDVIVSAPRPVVVLSLIHI